MPKKKQDKSNLLWWIVGTIVLIVVATIIFSRKTGVYVDEVGDVVYETSSECRVLDSTKIQCNCDVVIGGDTEHHNFSNTINATSCDNDICTNLCTNYADELVNK